MHSFLSRANTIFAFTLSVVAGLTFCCFLTTAFDEHQADVDIQTVRLFVKNVPDFTTDRSKNDLGFLSWDLKANLTHLFNWNVKQLFLYLTAEYETADNKLNQVFLWDKIIQRGENAVLDYKGLTTKYYFWDDGNGLLGNKNVTMTLSWNVVPNTGGLPRIMGQQKHSFQFPTEYS